MAFGVFIHRSDSIYNDSPAEKYQFPKQYLGRVNQCIGDWIIYLEPSKVRDTRGYFAVARIQQVIPDPSANGMYIAVIEPGTYLDFATPVPFSGAGGIVETGVLNEVGRISGRAQAAVRSLSPGDFNRIVSLGLDETTSLLPRIDEPAPANRVQEERAVFDYGLPVERERALVSRTVRDRVFRRVVLHAYDERCAITGLKLINGGGRAEAEAAHIQPVEANGPDVVSNGIALSGTVHWLFDRGMISLDDHLKILVSRQANDPAGIQALINPTGHALPTLRAGDRPHPHFLRWHRENCFKH